MPKYKKYDFIKILKEYNKEYTRKHKLNSNVSCVTVIHSLEDGTFSVVYTEDGYISPREYPLADFIYYNVAPSVDTGSFKALILRKEEQGLSIKIEIWPPSKIRYAYLYTNYFSNNVGHLGKSCMRGKDNQKALNFYVKNNVKIVVAVDGNNKIHARALLWDNVKTTRTKTSFTYLDRVYTRLEHLASPFYKLAEENEWKRYGSTSAGEAKSNYYKEDINIVGIYHLPYTDTFRYLYYKDSLISSGSAPSCIKHRDCCVQLTTTGNEGYFPDLDPNRVREALTSQYISKKDAVFVKRYNAYVLKKNIANVKGAYYSAHDNKVVESLLDGFILKVNSIAEVLTNELIDKTEAVHSAEYNGYMHKSNIIDIKGKMYHKKDTNIICFDNKWYHISQCFVEDGNLIPRNFAVIIYDLEEDKVTGELKYKEHYYIEKPVSKTDYIPLLTGEYIRNSSENKQHLKKFNSKYYIKQTFKLPSKHQLTLF